jgi:hypothetical protein
MTYAVKCRCKKILLFKALGRELPFAKKLHKPGKILKFSSFFTEKRVSGTKDPPIGAPMSKLTPLGQSMAALFTPEGENLRSSAKDGASSVRTSGQAFKVPGTEALKEGDKPQDSLGNPNSPGYSPLGLKKTGAAGEPGTTEG